jgi:putative ABC transport system permease protein
MMILKMAYKNLLRKPLSSLLSWLLLSLSVAIISVLMLFQQRFEKQFSASIRDVDMVIGAKGSPLQLILSAVFHIDAPTGNVRYSEAEKWMRHPYIASAIPLAYGDAYKGYSIVGTTAAFLQKPGISLKNGSANKSVFEVVAGHAVAQKLGLQPGSRFFSAHGNDAHAEEHGDHPYVVTGVLNPTGDVTDNLLITNLESVWEIHEHGEAAADEAHKENVNHSDEHHVHPAEDKNAGPEHDKELTAVLLKFRNPMASVQLPRLINEQSGLMAAVPAIEISRLFSLFGIGIDVLTSIGWGIMVISALSIFVALFNSLKERKYELALMRTMGAARSKLVWLLLLEAGMLCLAGLLTGLVLSRIIIWTLAGQIESDYHLAISPWMFQWPGEFHLSILTLCLGLVAALAPAISAWFLNISKTLSHE